VVLFWIIAAFQYRRHRAQLLLSLSTPTSNS
jgi:hypothetical protein